ncbi:MAG: hypothetical protein LBB61_06020 [Treponema sp.]|nr:hypothetical protein [Treponema sp.]
MTSTGSDAVVLEPVSSIPNFWSGKQGVLSSALKVFEPLRMEAVHSCGGTSPARAEMVHRCVRKWFTGACGAWGLHRRERRGRAVC